ncbi:hypothetical protein NC652_037173 [Populus alba x Populus x berolinensis]|nr:hypothetical protein NC652_037173 [Populus alba x Populus x berolinensis]
MYSYLLTRQKAFLILGSKELLSIVHALYILEIPTPLLHRCISSTILNPR